MHIDIHEAARRAIAEASRPLRAKRTPDNVIAAGGRKIRPQTHKQPDVIEVFSATAKGVVRGGIVNKRVQPNGGEPGRPWRRMLARALYEDQQRKKRPSQRSLIVHEGVLPKATKQDRGTLAALKDRGPQRLCKKYILRAT